MKLETFQKLMGGVIGVELSYSNAPDGAEPTTAISIINCLRHWKCNPPVPIRLRAVLDGGTEVNGSFKEELWLWQALKRRGLLERVQSLIPEDLHGQI